MDKEFDQANATILTDYFQYPWYIRLFGFNKAYTVQVLDEPFANGVMTGKWSYSVKLLSYDIRWFGMKLKTVKYDTI